MKRTLFLAAVLLAIGPGAVGFVLTRSPAAASTSGQFLTAVAAQRDIVDQATATGTVTSSARYALSFGTAPLLVSGTSTSSSSSTGSSTSASVTWPVTAVKVVVGDAVKKGQQLATADTANVRRRLGLADTDLQAAQGQLASAKTDLASAQSTLQTQLSQATSNLKASQVQLDQANAALASIDATLKGKLAVATASLNAATVQLAAARQQRTDATTDAAIRQARIAVYNAQGQVAQAQSTVDDLDAEIVGDHPAERLAVINAQAQVDQNKATIADLGSQLSGTHPKEQAAVYSAQSQVSTATQAVADLKTQIAAATLTAPVDGRVVAVSIQPGFDAPSSAAMTVDASNLLVTANVAEGDVATIKPGQPATVTISAVSATATGTVTQIAPASSSSAGSVVTYAVTVTIAATPPAARAGMSAQVTIDTQQALGVLAVPTSALQGSAGAYGVRVIDASGQVTAVPVTVGLVTNSLAEIQSGLNAGDRVVTGVVSSTTTTPVRGGFGGGGLGGGGLGGGGRGGGAGGGGGAAP